MTNLTGLSVSAFTSCTSARPAAGDVPESITIASVPFTNTGELAPTDIVPDAVA